MKRLEKLLPVLGFFDGFVVRSLSEVPFCLGDDVRDLDFKHDRHVKDDQEAE